MGGIVLRLSSWVLGVAIAAATFQTSGAVEPLFTPEAFVFAPPRQAADLRIFNNEERSLTWIAKVVQWQLDEAGHNIFTDTNDFRLETNRVEIGPGTGSVIRIVANQTEAREIERAYRIVLTTEKPSNDRVNVAYNYSLPIFVPEIARTRARAIDITNTEAGNVGIRISNTGSSHEFLETIRVAGIDGRKAETFSIEQQGWYILPQSSRIFLLKVSGPDCARTAALKIRAVFRDGPDLIEERPVQMICDPTLGKTGFFQPGSNIQPVD